MKQFISNTFGISGQQENPAEKTLRELGCEFKKRADGTLVVEGDVHLENRELTQLPDLSSVIVNGSFFCHDNLLTSLAGAPKAVGGDFYCNYNQLSSLKGAPDTVGGNFHCGNNQLSSLDGGPVTVGGYFSCGNNELQSLEGSPATVGGEFLCSSNNLVSLKGAPPTVGGNFYCDKSPSLTNLEGAPTTFKALYSDFGEFAAWEDVPEQLRTSPETKMKQQHQAEYNLKFKRDFEQALVLQKPLAAPKTARFKTLKL